MWSKSLGESQGNRIKAGGSQSFWRLTEAMASWGPLGPRPHTQIGLRQAREHSRTRGYPLFTIWKLVIQRRYTGQKFLSFHLEKKKKGQNNLKPVFNRVEERCFNVCHGNANLRLLLGKRPALSLPVLSSGHSACSHWFPTPRGKPRHRRTCSCAATQQVHPSQAGCHTASSPSSSVEGVWKMGRKGTEDTVDHTFPTRSCRLHCPHPGGFCAQM